MLFDDGAGSLRSRGSVLRLRRAGGSGLLTFKGPREVTGGVKSREERETEVADPDTLDGILRRLGYRRVFRYQKYRESWTHRGQAIEVDETPIGAFRRDRGRPRGDRGGGGPARLLGRRTTWATRTSTCSSPQGGEGDMVFEGQST